MTKLRKLLKQELEVSLLTPNYDFPTESSEALLLRNIRITKTLKLAQAFNTASYNFTEILRAQVLNMNQEEKDILVRAIIVLNRVMKELYSFSGNSLELLTDLIKVPEGSEEYKYLNPDSKAHIPYPYLLGYERYLKTRTPGQPWRVPSFKLINSFYNLRNLPVSKESLSTDKFISFLNSLEPLKEVQSITTLMLLISISKSTLEILAEPWRSSFIKVAFSRIRKILRRNTPARREALKTLNINSLRKIIL